MHPLVDSCMCPEGDRTRKLGALGGCSKRPGLMDCTVFKELRRRGEGKEKEGEEHQCARVPDEHLLSLKFVFGSSALQALDLVDRQSITLISSPSGRRVYQVLGSSGKMYTCLTSCHYCSCPAFAFSVLRKSDSLLGLAEAIEAMNR
ncbi:zinc finger SWIM domain-containing protein 7 isoform X2 [Desmodus rotundus]|uniref:zinc finger SWIM domain-containing protein 7 isoform X2 n=1 Tax=Desmodus rotundus TaxID=9430 RepID=UPI00238129F0|nr:zinc finger SWIM domain-containing protein 7 isoform X2 [Desmodus rotundus]